jgi:phosphonate metabolism protein PhnN/1,5-bisphosphokinase (PRPP-forming)
LVLVVGPSGAGKDSILRHAMTRCAGDDRFVFPRRCITRVVDTEAEDHDSLGEQVFDAQAALGAFALKWAAHGLKYGVRRDIDEDLAHGRVVSVNVSRTILADIALRYPQAIAVEISASPEIRAARIAARGRENATDITQRIGRSVPSTPAELRTTVIYNDGDISVAGEDFCRLLEGFELPPTGLS